MFVLRGALDARTLVPTQKSQGFEGSAEPAGVLPSIHKAPDSQLPPLYRQLRGPSRLCAWPAREDAESSLARLKSSGWARPHKRDGLRECESRPCLQERPGVKVPLIASRGKAGV